MLLCYHHCILEELMLVPVLLEEKQYLRKGACSPHQRRESFVIYGRLHLVQALLPLVQAAVYSKLVHL